MANKDDYLTDYRCFFENFAQTYNPHDQLPVKLGSYKLVNSEVVGGIIDWTTQYLTQKKCPQSLLYPLIKIIIEEVRSLCRKQTIACGFNPSDNAYEPLRLMQTVMSKTNEICLRYLDNSKLCSLPAPGPPYNVVSVCAIKNSRRRMEDRHVIVHDLNTLFTDQEVSPSSYYAIFDGHAGHDAAAYSCAHLHQFLGESKYFISNPEQALRDAFSKTDTLFNDKCKLENFRSGTTAVCALLRHKEKTLYIGWVGDSQAVLVGQGQCIQCVQPHKPSREDEKKRIEQLGGTVILWGTWRVNGQLAVSRAIGDLEYKPYVTAVPDILEIPLNGAEDFLIIACDGLWDVFSEQDAARCVYEEIVHNPDDTEAVSQHLVQQAKQHGSCDNISVIVVFLREPSKVAAEAHWATRHSLIMDTLDNANATNPFVNSNNPQKEGFVFGDGFKQNGTESSPTDFLRRPTNGKRSTDEFDEDEDLGPETNVDTIDDILLSPTISSKNLIGEIVNNNPNVFDSYCDNKEEKATLETDPDLQKHQANDEFDIIQAAREETPTPPADSVQDTSGLVDNVAESGDESEDEWNYYKGDQADKENIDPSQSDKEICDLTSDLDSDNMSQLNPNAAEFVPISPKRSTASPAYQALMDDLVIAQSPKRITNNDIDISVPNPQEFESEIKSRPSNVQECPKEDEAQNLSSQEIMENFLNGKTVEEIEFQPGSNPLIAQGGEFHFGPNATPFSTPGKFMDQSAALSTKAVLGDESNYMEDAQLDNSFTDNKSETLNKEQDPMSMSFYQEDKEDENPFDLDKVQVLPENIDDFLEKPKEENSLLDDTISDLPEHNPMNFENGTHTSPLPEVESREAQSPILERVILDEFKPDSPIPSAPSSGQLDVCERFDLQSPISSAYLGSQSSLPELQSPVPEMQNLIDADVAESPSPLREIESPVPQPRSPAFVTHSPLPDVQSQHLILEADLLTHVADSSPLLETRSPILSPVAKDFDMRTPLSPVQSPQHTEAFGSGSPLLPVGEAFDFRSPLVPQVCERRSPLSDVHSSLPESPLPESDVQPQVPESLATIELSQSPKPPLDLPLSPVKAPTPQVQSPVSPRQSPLPISPSPTQSPHPVVELDSPIEDVTSSVKDSPLPLLSPTEKPLSEVLNITQESEIFALDACSNVSPKSTFDTESVATTDVNSFLERSLIPDVASPLSGDETQIIGVCNTGLEDVNINECIVVTSERIVPEFAVPTVTTPSEESKTEDIQTVADVVAATAAAAVIDKKATAAKPKSAPAAKKPPTKTMPTTKPSTKPPTKPIASRPTATKVAQSKTPTSVAAKPAASKTTPTTLKAPERKSLTNGEAKPIAKKTPTATAACNRTTITKTLPPKLSPTKIGVDNKTPPISRPATAPAMSKLAPTRTGTAKPSPTATKTAAKPLAPAASKTAPNLVSKPKTTLAAPKPRPLPAKQAAKAPDTEKQIKESTNKQITARTNKTVGVPGKPATSVRKIDVKAPGTGSTVTKTTGKALDVKKPAELVRHSTNKVKPPTGVVRKSKVVTNGVTTKVTTTSTEAQLIKDISPVIENNVILDNSQILEVNNITD